MYQHSYYNSQVAYNKWMKSKDKLDATRNATQRRKKAVEKEAEVSLAKCCQSSVVMDMPL